MAERSPEKAGVGGSKRSVAGHYSKYLKTVFRKAGIPDGHTHQLRDTGAVELLKSGVDIRDVSKILGHKSLATTEKYYAPWNKAQQDRLDEKIRVAQQGMMAKAEAESKIAERA